MCLLKTFATFDEPLKVAAWSDKNLPVRPCDISMSCDTKYFFNCFNPKCLKEFKKKVSHVTGKRRKWCPHCRLNKNILAIEKKLDSLENVTYKKEKIVMINKRRLFWDVTVNNKGNVFHIESDGEQHFKLERLMHLRRIKDKEKGLEELKDQRVRDLSKENYIRNSGGLLFRISYRQLSKIPELVDKMINVSNSGVIGVHYMDNIYWNSLD